MTPLYNECRSALVATVLLCLAALAAPAAAQTVVDGSDRNVPPELLRAAVEAMADEGFVDPYGAQFRRLQLGERRRDFLCGWINLKNRLGAFTGFSPFYFASQTNNFSILPPKDDILYGLRSVIYDQLAGCPPDRR